MPKKPSFDTLIDRHGREIHVYLWRQLLDRKDAEDCFQDTFLRAFRAYPRLRAPANYRAWLYKIATNTAATFLKQRARLAGWTADLDPERLPQDTAFGEKLDTRFTLQEVRRAVDALPEKQKAALLLRNYQGLSYQEIGLALETNPAAARANVYQAIRKLRAQFEDTEVPAEAS